MWFTRKNLPRPGAKPLYGVNLGGWLLLEKWMTPSVFKDTKAVDEYTLMQSADAGITKRLHDHRENFISRSDFAWLQLHGIRVVRLPVGYWVFGNAEPYTPTVEYVDKAFKWAEECGMKILLDLHGAPGSQNGTQESGRMGRIGWHKDKINILKCLQVIRQLAERYKDSEALLGIELLNEPNSSTPRRKLRKYYRAAYTIIRELCGDEVWVVFSDNFKPRRWRRQLRAPKYVNTYIDTHQYQTYTKRDQKLDIAGHVAKTLGPVARRLQKMMKYHPVIVGEWSLVLNPRSLEGLNENQIEAAWRMYGNAQLISFERTHAWFYWSYKTENGGLWSFREAVEKGRLPNFAATK